MVGLNVADGLPKWQMVPQCGKTQIFWEGHEPEEKQALSEKHPPGKASRGVCWGGGHGQTPATPCHSQEGAGSHGCGIEEKERERRFQACLTSF